MARLFRKALVILGALLCHASVSAHEPRIQQPDAGKPLPFPGHEVRELSGYHDLEAGISLLELTLPPRTFGAPPHIHRQEDEIFYVLEGSVHFLDRETVVEAEAGTTVVLPRNHLHAFWNDSDSKVRLLLVIAPGHFSEFFDEVVQAIRKTNPDNAAAVGKLIAEAAQARQVEIYMDKVPESARHLLPR